MCKYFLIVAFLIFFTSTGHAQSQHAFWDEVQTIKKYDKQFKPPVRPVLFIGSSSIRKWDDVQYTFAKYKALNRGIGGAVINDIIYYLDDIVFPYHPKQIVLYVGENDIVNEKNTADTILNRTIDLFRLIRAKLPEVPIIYISMKPSPSRDKFVQKVIKSNLLIKNFLKSEKNVVYVDIFSKMLDKEGKSRPELFVGDKLHMNADGYAIWNKAIKGYLIKD